MEKYNELIKTLENYRDLPDQSGHEVLKETAVAIQTLQSAIDEKQRLLDRALGDLASCGDCKNCANLDHCSSHRIERNMAYGRCAQWQWKGSKAEEMAS